MKEAMKRDGALPALLRLVRRMNTARARVLTEIVQLMPNAYEMEEIHAFNGAEGDQTVEIHADDDGAVRRARVQDARASRTSAT